MKKVTEMILILAMIVSFIPNGVWSVAEAEDAVGTSEAQSMTAVDKIEIVAKSLPKNGSDDHNLLWGSDGIFGATVYFRDGTVAEGSNDEVTWSLEKADGTKIQAVYDEYTMQDGYSGIEVYVPFGYEEELILKAVSNTDPAVSAEYEINSVAKDKRWGKYMNGQTFFGFFVNLPKGAELTIDKVPAYMEAWDVENRSYSITLPVNPLRVRKHEFEGWLGSDGKLYQPEETVTVKRDEYSGAVYYFYASWKDLYPVTAPKKVTVSSVKRQSEKKALVTWKKISAVDGYQVVFSKNKNFKGAVTKNIAKSKKSYVISGLKKAQIYYVKIRAYRKNSVGRKVMGAYSTVKKIKKWKK